jgi:hypothetical protein
MSAVQPPLDAADQDPTPDDQGRVIDLPAGALSSTRTARGRTSRPNRSSRPSANADLGAALEASLADVTAAAERLGGEGSPPTPRRAAPRAPRPVSSKPAPAEGAAPPAPPTRPRAVPRQPAWQPVPWSEASARAARPAAARPAPAPPAQPVTPPPPRAAAPPRPAPARPAPPRPESPARTAITLPFPVQDGRPDAEEPARLRGLDVDTAPVRTVPGWLLVVMVVVATMVAALAAYLLMRP